MSSEEITAIVLMTAKPGREEELCEVFTWETKATHASDDGCINYIFHQRIDNPREFVCYERWRDQVALDAHWTRIFSVYGPPALDIPIPAAIFELFKKVDDIQLRVIE